MKFEVDTELMYADMFQFTIVCEILTRGLINYLEQKTGKADYDSLEKAIDNLTYNMREIMNFFCEEILRERAEEE